MFTCRAGMEAGDLITLVNEWKVRDDDLVLLSFDFFPIFLFFEYCGSMYVHKCDLMTLFNSTEGKRR